MDTEKLSHLTTFGIEKYSRGRRDSPAKGVGCDKRRPGSNPGFSAKPPKRAVFCCLYRIIAPCNLEISHQYELCSTAIKRACENSLWLTVARYFPKNPSIPAAIPSALRYSGREKSRQSVDQRGLEHWKLDSKLWIAPLAWHVSFPDQCLSRPGEIPLILLFHLVDARTPSLVELLRARVFFITMIISQNYGNCQ